jgi:hypothetical protein
VSRTGQRLIAGLLFGLACFTALTLPVLLSDAIFVNFHRGFVVGSVVSSLLTCLACGAICALLMG